MADTKDDHRETVDKIIHDLKSPIRNIETYTTILSDLISETEGNEQRYLNNIHREVGRSLAVLERLHTYAVISLKDHSFVFTDLYQLTDSVCFELAEELEATSMAISIGALPTVVADPLLLRQLFMCLISNSIKYRGEASPKIHIDATERENDWEICFKDNGIGFEPTYSEKVFNIGYRLHSNSKYEGTGFGLSICRKIIDLHHGKYGLEQKRVQKQKSILLSPKSVSLLSLDFKSSIAIEQVRYSTFYS